MNKDNHDEGVLTALILRFESYRLPRALSIKERVDAGETLKDSDVEYLKKLMKDSQQILPLIDKNPEYQGLVAKAIQLYQHITEKGLENEQKN